MTTKSISPLQQDARPVRIFSKDEKHNSDLMMSIFPGTPYPEMADTRARPMCVKTIRGPDPGLKIAPKSSGGSVIRNRSPQVNRMLTQP